jgi:hypothetical protein
VWGLQVHIRPLGQCVLLLLPMFEKEEGVGATAAPTAADCGLGGLCLGTLPPHQLFNAPWDSGWLRIRGGRPATAAGEYPRQDGGNPA